MSLHFTSRFIKTLPGEYPVSDFLPKFVKNVAWSQVPVKLPYERSKNPHLLLTASESFERQVFSHQGLSQHFHDFLFNNEEQDKNEQLCLYATRYGGHQFEHWADQLGDGRVVNFGELEGNKAATQSAFFAGQEFITLSDPVLIECQAKGLCATRYSRHADGRAVLRSSIREFLCSEYLASLQQVPTTRALCLSSTGNQVRRDQFYDGRVQLEPGAVVVRCAPSFLRFGSFELLAAHNELDLMHTMLNYLIDHFYTTNDDILSKETPCQRMIRFFERLFHASLYLVASWQSIGFTHGVLNTDNMSAIGVTLDFGPFGFMEQYDPEFTPNWSDHTSLYSFKKQPDAVVWNLKALATALRHYLNKCEAVSPDEKQREQEAQHFEAYILSELFHPVSKHLENAIAARFKDKLGFAQWKPDTDDDLLSDLFALLHREQMDFTNFFRNLDPSGKDNPPPALSQWMTRYQNRLVDDPLSHQERETLMQNTNPQIIPRNWIMQKLIGQVEDVIYTGQVHPDLDAYYKCLLNPYETPSRDEWMQPVDKSLAKKPGVTRLSCSS